jgi:hypothetical protein
MCELIVQLSITIGDERNSGSFALLSASINFSIDFRWIVDIS